MTNWLNSIAAIDDLPDPAGTGAGAFDLAAALAAVADIARIAAEKKRLRFVREVSPNLPRTVFADERQLRQVLLNLLDNAIRFTDFGQVRLKAIPLLGAPAGAALVRFEIADTGIGMTPDQVGSLFKPVPQAGDVRRRDGGPGLSVSHELVCLMGGEIHVESRIGVGSRFCFELVLPLASSRAEPQASREATP